MKLFECVFGKHTHTDTDTHTHPYAQNCGQLSDALKPDEVFSAR